VAEACFYVERYGPFRWQVRMRWWNGGSREVKSYWFRRSAEAAAKMLNKAPELQRK
jgi:hypothetical protein